MESTDSDRTRARKRNRDKRDLRRNWRFLQLVQMIVDRMGRVVVVRMLGDFMVVTMSLRGMRMRMVGVLDLSRRNLTRKRVIVPR